MCIIDCLSTIVFILPLHLDYTKVIILILWWRNFQLEYWRTFQLVSTDMTTTEENKDEKKKDIKRTKRLEARVTEKEYAKAVELAETCGLTLSDYIRKCALGQHPRRRLTDKEVEALCSLSDARGALMRIAAAVKSIQGSHRAQYFADTRFVEQWMRAAIPLMARWNEIQEYITQ